MEENRICAKPQYKCGICGKIYDDVQDRMNCEMNCIKRQKEEEKKAAEAKKKAEKDARCTEVSKALDNAYKLINDYVKDYGPYKYNGDLKDLDVLNMDFFPIKLWHHFWD